MTLQLQLIVSSSLDLRFFFFFYQIFLWLVSADFHQRVFHQITSRRASRGNKVGKSWENETKLKKYLSITILTVKAACMWPPQQALFRKQLRRGRLAQLSNPKIFLSLFPVQFRHFLSFQFILVITGKLIRNLAQTKWRSPLLCLTTTSQHDAWSRGSPVTKDNKSTANPSFTITCWFLEVYSNVKVLSKRYNWKISSWCLGKAKRDSILFTRTRSGG